MAAAARGGAACSLITPWNYPIYFCLRRGRKRLMRTLTKTLTRTLTRTLTSTSVPRNTGRLAGTSSPALFQRRWAAWRA